MGFAQERMRDRTRIGRRIPLFRSEPSVSVGLLTEAEHVHFVLEGEFRTREGDVLPAGEYRASPRARPAAIEVREVQERLVTITPTLALAPATPTASFTLLDVPIGKGFHWERKGAHRYAGMLTVHLSPGAPEDPPRLTVINELPVETYLMSVVSSEMSAQAPMEFLKAHAIISRSWLLAHLARRMNDVETLRPLAEWENPEEVEVIRWTDRTIHREFDVCAEDHCQRYYGLTPIATDAVATAVTETRGQVLCFEGEIGDARFSKCCGGATEDYGSAWEDRDVPYLRGGRFDGPEWPSDFPHPLTIEAHARAWILGSPPAYCRVRDLCVLEPLLSDVDRSTRDFFRWECCISQEELQALIQARLGLDLGAVRHLEPIQRGTSGRIVRLRLIGERGRVIVGKELEIRRLLSWTHLYSSAFVVFPEDVRAGIPHRFRLRGAGWGHGVGLCQIGAVLMAQQGRTCREILTHYYAPAEIVSAYE